MKSQIRIIGILLLVLCTFSANSQNWDEIIKTTASDRNASDFYGRSVAIDGDYAIVGAWGEDEDVAGANTKLESGSAYILHNDNGTWSEIQKIVASDRAVGDNFGYAVDISGDYAIVGAWKEDHDEIGNSPMSDAGSAYIFYNDGSSWIETQKIVASDRFDGDYFGQSVAIDGNYIVVGAFNEDEDASGLNSLNNAGSAYIFFNSGVIWSEQQKIVASDRSAADYFGFDVDIDGNYIIVGAYAEDEDATGIGGTLLEAGSAYIFENTGMWNELKKIIASDRAPGDFFGYSVAINLPVAIVGAYAEDENAAGTNTLSSAGSAYVYVDAILPLGNTEAVKLVASDREADDRFGYDVAINGTNIIVGAYFEDEDENQENELLQAGSAYIFDIPGTEQQKIVALDRESADYFGCAVGISGDYIISGAQLEDEDSDGNNTRPEAGSAYIFENCREINVSQVSDIIDGGTFDFGDIEYGSSSAELTFTIENTGWDDLILDGSPIVEISGVNAADFTINQSATTSPVAPSGSTTFTITFTPSTTTLHTAEISISNNDTDENPYNFTITGTGVKIPQTITFNPLATKTYGDADFIVSATASSGLDVVFTSSDNNIATCTGTNGTTITIVNAGTCDIYANQPGDAIYEAAPQVSQTLLVNPKDIEVTVNAGQTKEYGDSDPVYTYTVTTGSLETGDNFTGALTRVTGEAVGFYEIQQGTLSAGANYNLTYVSDDFEITERIIYVTADEGQSKETGQSDPGLTYSYTPELIGGDSFSGALTRVSGEDIGFYAILQGTLSLNANYIIDYTSKDFEITPKHITVTPNPGLSKVYGTSDPILTYTYSPALGGGDSFTGTLSRESGEDVGLYAITQGSLSAGSNYILTIESENMEITAKPITITANNMQSKMYGDSDPTFTYVQGGVLESGDFFTGELSREVGENVGFYAITLGTLSLGSNYNISFTSADFEITVKSLMVIPDSDQTKGYGQADPVLTFTTTSPIATWDTWSGALSREAGENIGNYEINQGTLTLNSNYNISFWPVAVNFEITKQTITVTADADQSKEYGEADPTYTYTYVGTLASGDNFTGSLNRTYGENVGTYNINQGSLWISSNYIINYVGDVFEITTRAITVDADIDQTKVYGNADPAVYTYTVTGTLVGGDDFTGSLSRVTGEEVGSYTIQQGSLALNSNYTITYNPANFVITAKNITVTADAGQSKEYNDPDPAEYTYTITTGALVGGDSFTGALIREAGEGIGTYEIQQGTLDAGTNYNLTYESDYFEITTKNITVTVDPNQTKTYGETDPAEYTYTYSPALFGEDSFIGALTREAGENAGDYEIQIGSLQLSSLYNIIYESDVFVIYKADPIITWDNPTDIYYPNALSPTQLNAVADVPGIFTYNPIEGTVLEIGDNQELTCEFTPDDITNYNIVSANAYINVLLGSKVESYYTDLKVYPNPTRENLFIDFGEPTEANIKVVDITGKVVVEKTTNSSIETLDMSELPMGVYILNISLETSDNIIIKRVVMQ